MKRALAIAGIAAIAQATTLIRPILGTIAYLTSRHTLDQQRQAIAAAIRTPDPDEIGFTTSNDGGVW